MIVKPVSAIASPSDAEPLIVKIKSVPIDANSTNTTTTDTTHSMPSCSKSFLTSKGFNIHFSGVHQTLQNFGATT